MFASVPVLLKTRKLRRVPMVPDGNCFYRAVAAAVHGSPKTHKDLRSRLMDHMLEMEATYSPFFESQARFRRVLAANKRLGVWNSDLADIVPCAVANLLGVVLEVYSVTDDDSVVRYSFNEEQTGGQKIRLLHEHNHYDLLLK
jgi:hypothetical protein